MLLLLFYVNYYILEASNNSVSVRKQPVLLGLLGGLIIRKQKDFTEITEFHLAVSLVHNTTEKHLVPSFAL